MRQTNRATQFSRDLVEALNKCKVPGVCKWIKDWKPDGIQYGGVDAAGLRGDLSPLILVEAELRRQNPVSNVVKVWMWGASGNFKRPVLMVQAFSAIFMDSRSEHKLRAKFIGERMQGDLQGRVYYKDVDLIFKPRKGGKVGGGRRRFHAKALAKKISQLYIEYRDRIT